MYLLLVFLFNGHYHTRQFNLTQIKMNTHIEWLDKIKIEAEISPANRARLSRLEVIESIDSTNTYLLKQAKTYPESGFVCLAEEQTQGRGRQGKQWFSPRGASIFCSLLWRFPSAHTDIAHLSLAVGVMLLKALARYGVGSGLRLKWPNDVYFMQRKLAGILIEGLPSHESTYPVVIGFGLNVRLPMDNPFAQSSIDITEIVQGQVERNKLAGLLINELLGELPHYAEKGFAAFLPDWNRYDMLRNKWVVIRSGEHEITGIAQGVNERGELIMRDQYGKIHAFRCGEVSVRLS
ncbi:biotin--[acetyl-CoA-carboxylase] ligase [Aquicella lusitana]|uniref:BirA family biotin operon repressor/biotin-[acetyl-CoA-carboxylase] ligase n=1 Tax=Aquicella lusitana TaxID=254246 RepID=A0A370H142_9COXI|nr:biotin--[acetyl-CoA-carboxylase] ligase [Aquicella lusitana]RDI48704.1 BirA family biotin operon repressor/biotin-[acetyl-CoA-carboxylase] ligase [Aquicella lusitana]VVC73919.1 Bifunctional ligase/repressor BirA [Aquicella lusitana]